MFSLFRKRRPSASDTGARQLFDAGDYLARNPDVAAAGSDPFAHYMSFGWKEGRDPSAKFSTLAYTERYMRGDASGLNPLEHYLRTGRERGHEPAPAPDALRRLQAEVIAPVFDQDFYLDQILPLLSYDTREEMIDHYLAEGWRIGLDPHPGFSGKAYASENPYAAATALSPLFHYLAVRRLREPGLAPDAPLAMNSVERMVRRYEEEIAETVVAEHVDGRFYLREYSDLKGHHLSPLRHYVRYGWKEGRNPSALFWTGYYQEQHADLLQLERHPERQPLLHYALEGKAAGLAPNPVGDRFLPVLTAPPDEAWAGLARPHAAGPADITIIMPVYRGYDDTLSAIHSVLREPQRTPFRLLVINDKGPEPRLAERLAELAGRGLFDYVENEINLGFVHTCNRGIGLSGGNVVLLNSDVEVYGDWLDRLVAHAARDLRVATVTPLSNNATICSYPADLKNNLLELEVSSAELDAYAAACNRGLSREVPTGVGFCFYMSRLAINAVGALDAASFGKGYGEENDFCMRAKKAGFVNLLANDIFVRHTGQVSFSTIAGDEYGEGQNALHFKHPDYPISVFKYVAENLNRDARRRLDLYRMAKALGPRIVLFVTHALDGGILTHIRRLADRLHAEGVNVVFLRIGHPVDGLVEVQPHDAVRLYCPNLYALDLDKDEGLFEEFLGWCEPEFVHVHSLVSGSWRTAERLMARLTGRYPYDMTMHDFSSICHRNTLVYPDGNYCGMPPTETCRRCIRDDHRAVGVVDPDERRAYYAGLMRGARTVMTPSRDTARRLATVFPDQAFKVMPHEELFAFPRAAMPEDGVRRIVTVGAIGPTKGSCVLHSLAVDAKQRGLPLSYHVIGYSDISSLLREAGVEETGKYHGDADFLGLVTEIAPHLCLIPSIWPETFCYALSLPMALGIPVVSFNIGAQADRLRAEGYGNVLPFDYVRHPQKINDYFMRVPLEDLWAKSRPVAFARYESVLRDYYGLDAAPAARAAA